MHKFPVQCLYYKPSFWCLEGEKIFLPKLNSFTIISDNIILSLTIFLRCSVRLKSGIYYFNLLRSSKFYSSVPVALTVCFLDVHLRTLAVWLTQIYMLVIISFMRWDQRHPRLPYPLSVGSCANAYFYLFRHTCSPRWWVSLMVFHFFGVAVVVVLSISL